MQALEICVHLKCILHIKFVKLQNFFNMNIYIHVQGTYWISEFSAGDPLEHHEVGFDRTSGTQK